MSRPRRWRARRRSLPPRAACASSLALLGAGRHATVSTQRVVRSPRGGDARDVVEADPGGMTSPASARRRDGRGPDQALRRPGCRRGPLLRAAAWRRGRVHRPERRRQDDDHGDAARPRHADGWPRIRPRPPARQAGQLPPTRRRAHRGSRHVPRAHGHREPPRPRGDGQPGRLADPARAGAGRPGRPGRRPLPRVLDGHEAAARDRRRPPRRSRAADPRRADQRPRPRRDARDPRPDRRHRIGRAGPCSSPRTCSARSSRCATGSW